MKIMYNWAIEHNQSVQVVQSVAIKPQTTFKKNIGLIGGIFSIDAIYFVSMTTLRYTDIEKTVIQTHVVIVTKAVIIAQKTTNAWHLVQWLIVMYWSISRPVPMFIMRCLVTVARDHTVLATDCHLVSLIYIFSGITINCYNIKLIADHS